LRFVRGVGAREDAIVDVAAGVPLIRRSDGLESPAVLFPEFLKGPSHVDF